MFTVFIVVGVITALIWLFGSVGHFPGDLVAVARIVCIICIIGILVMLLLGHAHFNAWW